MTAGWAFEVLRDDLTRTATVHVDVPEPADGEAVLRVDRVGLSANNVTYAVFGEAMRYWELFPASPRFGRVPLWGFADVVASRTPGVEVGQRLYGYLPTASHLLVRPDRVDNAGFRDSSKHRASLPGVYNTYTLTSGDLLYEAEREDLQVLFRPLFSTSFLLADQVREQPAEVVALSSASSKTAYGTAYLLRGGDAEVVGLTSAGNIGFTRSLGCYDRVLTYDEAAELAVVPTAYVDLSGSTSLRRALHQHLTDELVADLVVGATHNDPTPSGELPGAPPSFFFAPARVKSRAAEWGRDELDRRLAAAWHDFAAAASAWVDISVSPGPDALRDVWLEVQGGRSSPRTGHVLVF